uniref:WGS project CBMG000000000 data, contig CS5907-c000473 n=1 Tax=Fusarium acuminatum CS5907 TaxID=1318461 RepID=A0A096PF70_9HYPO|nr:unnamed protein product [Fusarium acuminatum CS5907]
MIRSPSNLETDLNNLPDDEDDSRFIDIAITIMTKLLQDDAKERGTPDNNIFAHALYLCNVVDRQGKKQEAARLFVLISAYSCKQQAWRDMEKVAGKALRLRTEDLGEKHIDTLWSLGDLASSLYAQSQYREATELFRRLLALRQEALGAEHPHTIWSMGSLAITYGMQGLYGDAENIFVSLLAFQQKTMGEKHEDTITTMCNLAATYFGQCRYDKTEETLISVLAFHLEVLGDTHPRTSQVKRNLSQVRQVRAASVSNLS